MADVEQADVELDLTNRHLSSLHDIQISEQLQYVDLTCNRLTELDPRIEALKGMKSLNLRQNLLATAAFVQRLQAKGVLEDLELRDNQLTEVPDLAGLQSLTRLELSYNQIRDITPLERLPAQGLQQLYLACNKITAIQGLGSLSRLQVLELGSNRIRAIEALDHMTGLEELWMGHNRVSELQGLSCLASLKKLSLQSNRLAAISGLAQCVQLEELTLSHNGISAVQGLDTLTNLRLLDLSNNALASIEGLPALPLLQDLWLNHNQLPTLEALHPSLEPLQASVTCIYLEGNPAAKAKEYKQRVVSMLPKLVQLDADDV